MSNLKLYLNMITYLLNIGEKMIAKFILIPEWMSHKLAKIKKHSGQSQNAIIRLALADYIKKYMAENKLIN